MKLYLLMLLASITLHTSKTYHNLNGKEEIGISSCSGVWIGPNRILTARHCVEGSRGHQWIKTSEGKVYTAVIMDISLHSDLTLLFIPAMPDHAYVSLGKEPVITEQVYTVNSGMDYPSTYNTGIVNNMVEIDEDEPPMIMHTASILSGASGSGLFDKKGRLIGINVRAKEPFALAVDLKDIKVFLNEANIN